jgi:hypothetical protein
MADLISILHHLGLWNTLPKESQLARRLVSKQFCAQAYQDDQHAHVQINNKRQSRESIDTRNVQYGASLARYHNKLHKIKSLTITGDKCSCSVMNIALSSWLRTLSMGRLDHVEECTISTKTSLSHVLLIDLFLEMPYLRKLTLHCDEVFPFPPVLSQIICRTLKSLTINLIDVSESENVKAFFMDFGRRTHTIWIHLTELRINALPDSNHIITNNMLCKWAKCMPELETLWLSNGIVKDAETLQDLKFDQLKNLIFSKHGNENTSSWISQYDGFIRLDYEVLNKLSRLSHNVTIWGLQFDACNFATCIVMEDILRKNKTNKNGVVALIQDIEAIDQLYPVPSCINLEVRLTFDSIDIELQAIADAFSGVKTLLVHIDDPDETCCTHYTNLVCILLKRLGHLENVYISCGVETYFETSWIGRFLKQALAVAKRKDMHWFFRNMLHQEIALMKDLYKNTLV